MHFLLSYDAKGHIKAQLSVGYYVDVLCALMIAFGLVFQLPMVADLPHPTGTGIVTPAREKLSLCGGIDVCRGGGVDPYP